MPKINRETLNPVAVAVPPEGEQIEIAAYLSMATEGSDRLTTEATLAIDLLQERRSALISAAVTGQIDVRGLALKDAL
jgi:type I restriction enzyme S subunit